MQFKRITPAFLDQAERFLFVVVYLVFAIRMTRAYLLDGGIVQLLYLLDQFIVLLFLVSRRRTDLITTHPSEWFAGLIGAYIPLMIGAVAPEGALVPLPFAAFLIVFGTIVHLLAKLTLRRSFGAIAANRGVKASGAYRYVRHPMYLGYMLSQTGILLAGPTIRNVSVVLLCWICFIWRISAEERLLATDAAYKDLMEQTPYRLIPGLY